MCLCVCLLSTLALCAQGSYSANGGIEEGIDESIQDIITNTKGVAFYSTPHFGSWIASASYNLIPWRLKDTINVVLRPGPYLSDLNDFFNKFSEAQRVNVISFAGPSARSRASLLATKPPKHHILSSHLTKTNENAN